MKLTIEQLKNYLGTGLKVIRNGINDELIGIRNDKAITEGFGVCFIEALKLKCYRLSDLDKFIPELGFVPIEKLNKEFGYESCRLTKFVSPLEVGWVIDYGSDTAITWSDMYPIIQKFFQWHFWPFGDEYFEAGLVIDKLLYNSPTH